MAPALLEDQRAAGPAVACEAMPSRATRLQGMAETRTPNQTHHPKTAARSPPSSSCLFPPWRHDIRSDARLAWHHDFMLACMCRRYQHASRTRGRRSDLKMLTEADRTCQGNLVVGRPGQATAPVEALLFRFVSYVVRPMYRYLLARIDAVTNGRCRTSHS